MHDCNLFGRMRYTAHLKRPTQEVRPTKIQQLKYTAKCCYTSV